MLNKHTQYDMSNKYAQHDMLNQFKRYNTLRKYTQYNSFLQRLCESCHLYKRIHGLINENNRSTNAISTIDEEALRRTWQEINFFCFYIYIKHSCVIVITELNVLQKCI